MNPSRVESSTISARGSVQPSGMPWPRNNSVHFSRGTTTTSKVRPKANLWFRNRSRDRQIYKNRRLFRSTDREEQKSPADRASHTSLGDCFLKKTATAGCSAGKSRAENERDRNLSISSHPETSFIAPSGLTSGPLFESCASSKRKLAFLMPLSSVTDFRYPRSEVSTNRPVTH
jgi:hypothetical protein